MFQFAIIFFSSLTILSAILVASVAAYSAIQEERILNEGGVHANDRLMAIFGVLCAFVGIMASDTESVFQSASVFVFSGPVLVEALRRFKSSVDPRSTLACLTHVLISKADHAVTLAATDLETFHEQAVWGTCSTDKAAIALPYKALVDVAKNAGKGSVNIEIEENGVWTTITLENGSKSRVKGLHADDFPQNHFGRQKTYLGSIPACVLIDGLKSVAPTMSKDDARPNLVGMYLAKTSQGVTLCATDGHRLNKAVIQSTVEFEGEIVHADSIKALIQAIEVQGVDINVFRCADRGLAFVQGTQTIYTRLVDGSFPDFTQVLPKEVPLAESAQVDRKALIKAIKEISKYSYKKTNNIRVSLEQDCIELYATDPDKGEALIKVDCLYSAPPVKVGFNWRYLIDALSAISTGDAAITIRDTLSPASINAIEGATSEPLCIVMPMRL